jgi:dolichol-phosphate mannosyltransferase
MAPIERARGDGPVLVVVPTYDERENVDRLISGLRRSVDDLNILIIDDGSPDGTAEAVRRLMVEDPRLHLIERPGKAGLAGAYLAGFAWGIERGFDLIVEMDADLSHRPEDLPRLLRGASRHDLVVGSRYVRGGAVSNWSRARLALSRGANLYAGVMLGLPVKDATSGFRVYRRPAIEFLTSEPPGSEGYGFQIELVYRAHRAGFSIAEVPITFQEREHGISKLSRAIVVEALFEVARWSIRDRLIARRRVPASIAPHEG